MARSGYRQRVLLVLAACDPPPSPPPPTAPPAQGPWWLSGRATPGGVDFPDLVGGRSRLGPACLAGELDPCWAEAWTNGVQVVEFIRRGPKVTRDGARAQSRWRQVTGVLAVCVGDPLGATPAGDLQARRAFTGEHWELTLSGQNACGLAGTLRLRVDADIADWRSLTVEGHAWEHGGREAVLRRIGIDPQPEVSAR
jgi:hypothetical protein